MNPFFKNFTSLKNSFSQKNFEKLIYFTRISKVFQKNYFKILNFNGVTQKFSMNAVLQNFTKNRNKNGSDPEGAIGNGMKSLGKFGENQSHFVEEFKLSNQHLMNNFHQSGIIKKLRVKPFMFAPKTKKIFRCFGKTIKLSFSQFLTKYLLGFCLFSERN